MAKFEPSNFIAGNLDADVADFLFEEFKSKKLDEKKNNRFEKTHIGRVK